MAKYKLTINTTFTSKQLCTRSQADNECRCCSPTLNSDNHINNHILTLEVLNLIQYEIIIHLQLQRPEYFMHDTLNNQHYYAYIHLHPHVRVYIRVENTKPNRNTSKIDY